MSKPMITLDLSKYIVLREQYLKLSHDLRLKTKSSVSVKKLSALLGQNFKTKKEAFMFIHDMLEYNKEHTLDICGMGDCPSIEVNDIAAESIGSWIVTWQTDEGVMQESKKLCQDCKDFLAGANCLGEEVVKQESTPTGTETEK